MIRMNIDKAGPDVVRFVDRCVHEGAPVELERDGRVIAQVTPLGHAKAVTAADWNKLFRELPDLGDDSEAFARDVEAARAMQTPVRDPWA